MKTGQILHLSIAFKFSNQFSGRLKCGFSFSRTVYRTKSRLNWYSVIFNPHDSHVSIPSKPNNASTEWRNVRADFLCSTHYYCSSKRFTILIKSIQFNRNHFANASFNNYDYKKIFHSSFVGPCVGHHAMNSKYLSEQLERKIVCKKYYYNGIQQVLVGRNWGLFRSDQSECDYQLCWTRCYSIDHPQIPHNFFLSPLFLWHFLCPIGRPNQFIWCVIHFLLAVSFT